MFFNCEDAIDIEQPGRLSPEVTFETIEDLRQGLLGAYAEFDLTREVSMSANFTDETAQGVSSGGQGENTSFVFNLTAASAASSTFWINGYQELNALNRVIEASSLITPEGDVEQTEFDDILGQAFALRAFSHFQLLSYYTTDYTDDNALGVIKMDFVPSVSDKLLRNTNGEIYELIEEDLNKASTMIEDQANPIFVSKDFVTALRARMAAYRQDYAAAETFATQLLTSYPLADRDSYKDMFIDENNDEIIFKLDRVFNGPYDNQPTAGSVASQGWLGGVFAFTNATVGGGAYYEFGRSLFNLFDPNDIRYDVCLAPTSIVAPDYQNTTNYLAEDVLVIAKYPGIPEQTLLNDQKVFRASEMQLILAEVYASRGNINGPTNSTASAIKELRDARFGSDQPLPSYADEIEAFAAILNERRVEFAFEGHRWKDIKRLGVRANQGAERDPIDATEFNMTQSLPPTDHRFTLAIPIVEFNANPALREQQNPGY